MDLAQLLDFPVDAQMEKKFRGQHEQLELLLEVRTELIRAESSQTKFCSKFAAFHEGLQKKIIPVLSKLLFKEREDICSSLQALYSLQTEDLIKCNNANMSRYFQRETERHSAIDLITYDLELLETLGWDTSSKSLTSVYKGLTSVGQENLRNVLQVEHTQQLEEDHNSLETCLRNLSQEYISCRNHSALTASAKLKDNMEEWREKFIICNELVTGLMCEINDFTNSIITSFQEEKLNANLNLKTIEKKLEIISSLHLQIEGHHSREACNADTVIISDEMEYTSKLLLNDHLQEAVKLKVQDLQGQTETFLKSLRDAKHLKCSVIKNCISSLSSIHDKLGKWSQCLSLVSFLKEYVTTFKYQNNENVPWLATSPITTDSSLFLHLQSVLPQTEQVFLSTFQSHAWGDLTALAIKLINYSAQWKIEFPQKSVCLVTGNYIKFSSFCNLPELDRDELKEIRVVAREAVFIDEDLHDRKRRELEVFVIAPRVQVVGKREINLDGRNANTDKSLGWYSYARAEEGRNGRPGKPGGNGGHFRVICITIKNPRNLRINCRGGDGGRGQNGGNGRNGTRGRDGNIRDLFLGVGTCKGQPGTPGGNGGHGGRGGHPGYGGSASIQCYGSSADAEKISICNENGKWGIHGDGGTEGQGGRNGDGYMREKGILWGYNDKIILCRTYAYNGSPGQRGKNTQGQELPQQKQAPASLGEAISDFRYLSMAQDAESAKLLLEKIDENQEMSQLSPQLLASDLFKLEAGQETSQIISEHESFQQRLLRYSKWKEENGDADEETNYVLSLLYTLSVSKALVLKSHWNNDKMQGVQVINIQGYFDTVAETIKRLESSHIEVDRRNALQDYQDHLRRKCEDTQYHISKSVFPAIKDASRRIQGEIENCLKELNCYENQVEEDLHQRHRKYYQYVESVQKWQAFRTLLWALSMGCEVALMYGKLSPHILTAISLTKMTSKGLMKIGDKQTPDVPTSEPKVELPGCLKMSSDFLPEMRERGNEMSRQVQLMSSFLETNAELHSELSQILEAWRNSVEKFGLVPDTNLLDAYTALMEMERYREETLEVLGNLKDSAKISHEVKVQVEGLILQLNVCNCNPNFGTDNIDARLDHSGVTDPQLRSIKKRQMTIYEVLIPLVQRITEEFGQSVNKSSETSAAGRKIKNRLMRKTLGELKDKMSHFVKDMKSEKMLMASIQNFEEAMSLLNDLYDMMEGYEESKIFSDTMYQLNTQHVNIASSISDPDLKNIVTKINFLLKANSFLLDYNEAVKSFKQWVFPFANKYLSSAQISSLDVDTILEDVGDNYQEKLQKWLATYIERFEELRSHIGRYRSMTMDVDSVVFTGRFSSAAKTICPPFFVWHWKEFGDTIGKLLAGEEIQLRSNMQTASLNDGGKRGAVKFKNVQLVLKHRKGYLSMEQKELQKILKGFTVTMTHSGISYYRLFSQCFVIRGNKQEYCYSLDESTRNMTYEKTGNSSSDYLLSPYTLWTFKLNNVRGESQSGNELQKFVGQVSLQLEGDGWYVDEKAALKKGLDKDYLKDLHNHYELIDL